ncbi:hypothetical protein EJ110_NYTH30930 [Nymphaea thermarum]|nr:hypothetical protein EJ110_NYTH30930 [Nymphaea thermarum]
MVVGSFSVLLPSRIILPANTYRSFPLPCGRTPFAFFFLLSQTYPSLRPRRNRRKFRVFCSQGDDINKGTSQNGNNGSNAQEEPDGNQRPAFLFRWADLLNPDPQNILAVGLTGLLTWASVQVLWQILFISVAIVVAALKYSLVAAILLFIGSTHMFKNVSGHREY